MDKPAVQERRHRASRTTRHSIRVLLAMLVLALVVPLLSLAAYFGVQRFRSEQARAGESLIASADATALGVHQFLQDTRRLVDGIAADPQLLALDPENCGPYFSPAAERILVPTYTNLATWDLDGTPVCSKLPGEAGPDVTPIPGLEEALASDGFTLTPVQKGRRSGRWMTALTRPLYDGSGAKVGLLSVSIDLLRLQQILLELTPPEGSIISITETSGTVVARSKDPEAWVGKNPPAVDAESPDGPTFASRGYSRATTFDGESFSWGFVRIPETDWMVYVGIPYAEAFGGTFRGGIEFLLLGLLVVGGAFVLGRTVYLRITAPLQSLVEGITGAGETTRLPTDGPREIAWVAESLNTAWEARAQAERERERSDARIRSLVENAVTAIYVVTESGRFVEVNQAMVDLLGYASREELLATPATALHPSPEARKNQLEQHGQSPAFHSVPVEWVRKDGTKVNVRLSGRRRRLEDLEVAWEIIAEDVTELARLQAQALQAQKMEALGRLAGGIAHDFNNLLTVVQGQAEMLRDDPELGEEQQEQAEEIYLATVRGAALNRQLLAFGRRSPGDKRAVSVNDVVRQFELVLRRAVGEEVQLSLDLAPVLPSIRADRSQIEQILMNLVVNARDAMHESGHLVIRTCTADVDLEDAAQQADGHGGKHVVLEIRDSGSGIPDDILPHIFEPFYSTKPDTKGTGLGLATVYGIVTDSGGHIRVDSVHGEGTGFLIHFPVLEGSESAAHPTPAQGVRQKGSGVVLLVEDEDAVRRLAQIILERAGYTVLSASDGLEALGRVESWDGPIDLLLSDIVMPGIRGHQLAQTLAAAGRVARAVFFSGYPEGFSEEGLDQLEQWEFISKPFNSADLLDAVARVIRGETTAEHPPTAKEPRAPMTPPAGA